MKCQIAGWGNTTTHGLPKTLQKLDVVTMDQFSAVNAIGDKALRRWDIIFAHKNNNCGFGISNVLHC